MISLEMIDKYIDSKKNAWADSTLKSERSRIISVREYIDGNPLTLWNYLQKYKQYTRVTYYTRICELWAFCYNANTTENNEYIKFRKTNGRLFKNAYKRKELRISFEEALNKIKSIQENDIRKKALQLLYSGMRYTESLEISEDGYIIGKGDKQRKIFIPKELENLKKISYIKLLRRLKKVGLTPHMLRKLAASKFVELGMKEADLLKLMGWNSITTAQYYLQPKSDDIIKETLKEVWKND